MNFWVLLSIVDNFSKEKNQQLHLRIRRVSVDTLIIFSNTPRNYIYLKRKFFFESIETIDAFFWWNGSCPAEYVVISSFWRGTAAAILSQRKWFKNKASRAMW